MKKIFLIFLILFYCKSFSQSSKEFLLNDNEKIYNTLLTDVISESKDYGYNLFRNDEGNYIFYDGLKKYFILKKDVQFENEETFPKYSVGWIKKKYYFTEETIDKAIAWKIETEISLVEYELLSYFQIDKCFREIKNEIISNNSDHNYVTSSTINKLNFKSMSGLSYDIIEENSIAIPCPGTENEEKKDCFIESIFSNGRCDVEHKLKSGKINIHFFTFLFGHKEMSELQEIFSKSNSSLDYERFTIGGQDIRKINQYDLEAMVKFFIEDCKKTNKNVPEINKLKATFEPLEGSVIALSYGYGDDSTIVIKVDPEKWAKSSIEKKWYVLYHELGHDVLNLEHGQGGKMMFNFADKEYSWDDFFNDKDYMMNSLKDKVICCAIETVKIGSQEWTVKNLDVSRYRNGDIIPEVKDPIEWANLKTGAWCYYDNDSKNGAIYGKLYNWYAVADPRGIAPEGFHIPSDDEWKTLNNYIDSEKINGIEKKVLRNTHQYYELGDEVESRFKGLPGGTRLISKNGTAYFSSIDFDGAWWNSSGSITNCNLYNSVNYYFYGSANCYKNNSPPAGFSLRCIKD